MSLVHFLVLALEEAQNCLHLSPTSIFNPISQPRKTLGLNIRAFKDVSPLASRHYNPSFLTYDAGPVFT